jgi:hypothetical protein
MDPMGLILQMISSQMSGLRRHARSMDWSRLRRAGQVYRSQPPGLGPQGRQGARLVDLRWFDMNIILYYNGFDNWYGFYMVLIWFDLIWFNIYRLIIIVYEWIIWVWSILDPFLTRFVCGCFFGLGHLWVIISPPFTVDRQLLNLKWLNLCHFQLNPQLNWFEWLLLSIEIPIYCNSTG